MSRGMLSAGGPGKQGEEKPVRERVSFRYQQARHGPAGANLLIKDGTDGVALVGSKWGDANGLLFSNWAKRRT